MDSTRWVFAKVCLLAVPGLALAEAPAPRSTLAVTKASQSAALGNVAVEINALRSLHGKIGCAIFRDPKGFPTKPNTHAFKQRWVSVHSSRVGCAFEALPPGDYAVTVLHDENENARMDLSFIGAPKEGYGVSNNRTHAMRAPRWEESRFQLRPGSSVRLQVKLRY